MLSTFCGNCGTYYKILGGQAVAQQPAFSDLYGLGSTPSPASKPSIREARSRPQYQRRRKRAEEAAGAKPAPRTAREVSCLKCGQTHEIPERAASSPCPRCGSDIPLQNVVITELWSEPIRTRGDVHVTHTGRITEVEVRCYHLTIDGDFNGRADCDGDLTIRRHGEILGPVRCRHLIVEKRAEVVFASTVHADSVTIDGSVQGDIHCQGCLTLKKDATLYGNIQIASLAISEGARHHGMVRMSPPKA